MFIVYVDSSGRPYNDPEDFILASISTNEEDWQYIDNLVKQIKIEHFPFMPDKEIEIHAKDMVTIRVYLSIFRGMLILYSLLGNHTIFSVRQSSSLNKIFLAANF